MRDEWHCHRSSTFIKRDFQLLAWSNCIKHIRVGLSLDIRPPNQVLHSYNRGSFCLQPPPKTNPNVFHLNKNLLLFLCILSREKTCFGGTTSQRERLSGWRYGIELVPFWRENHTVHHWIMILLIALAKILDLHLETHRPAIELCTFQSQNVSFKSWKSHFFACPAGGVPFFYFHIFVLNYLKIA